LLQFEELLSDLDFLKILVALLLLLALPQLLPLLMGGTWDRGL
jgi:hypothetical protein